MTWLDCVSEDPCHKQCYQWVRGEIGGRERQVRQLLQKPRERIKWAPKNGGGKEGGIREKESC